MLRLLIGAFLCVTPGWTQLNGFYFRCSTAMVCVDRSFCDKIGVISKTAVSLTDDEELFRMPILPCVIPGGGGSNGFCCRDPDYKDDWPIDTSTRPPCNAPFIRHPNGKCGCKDRFTETPGGKCECILPLQETLRGTCECKPPTKPTSDGGCCLPPNCPFEPCNPPKELLPNGTCGCKPPLQETPGGKCECKRPAKLTSFGECCLPPNCPPEPCQPPKVLLDGICKCLPPLQETLGGTCECKPPARLLIDGGCCLPPDCPSVPLTCNSTDEILLQNGTCICKKPKQRTRGGTCDEIGGPVGPGCPIRKRPEKREIEFKADISEFPWQSAVFTTKGKFLCSASFTPNSTCTTTASCVKDYKPFELQVYFGINNIADPFSITGYPPQYYTPKYIAYDDHYNPTAPGLHDLAILNFGQQHITENDYTRAICLDKDKVIQNHNWDDCVVTGWGNDDTYYWTDVKLLSKNECKKLIPGFDPEITSCGRASHDVCAWNLEFGGGLQCRELGKRKKRGMDVYYLQGVYSGVDCSSKGEKVLTFSTSAFQWFVDAFINPEAYPLFG